METVKTVIWGDEEMTADDAIGGKGAGLRRLTLLGIPVPAWGVLTTALFDRVCGEDGEIRRILSDGNADPLARAALLRERIAAISPDGAVREMLHTVWMRISDAGTAPVAVRSSARGEDSGSLSFAGQMDSFLNVRDEESFLRAIKGCWASLFGERAVSYRLANGIDPWQVRTAVVVQRMIEADAAGVLFTANPLTGNRREMLVSGVWGLGEGLVSGLLDADTYILDESGRSVQVELAEKRERIVYAADGGTTTVPVPADRVSAPSLEPALLAELHRLGSIMQAAEGIPMDLEFAVAGGRVHLLQARPITTLGAECAAGGDRTDVWDNSNIVESYAGVTTPLTFSFIRSAYTAVYIQFWETIGVDRKTVFRNRQIPENMLGLIEGRVYYNLLNWYRLIALMPGFAYNKGFMEQMMGLQTAADFSPEQKPAGTMERYLLQLPRLVRVGLQMLREHLLLERRIAAFQEDFGRFYARYSALEFDRTSPSEIMRLYRTMEEEILWNWKAPILNDFEAMIFYGLLKRLTVAWGLDPDGTLQNDLLCGAGNIRSTEVTARLFAIAREIAAQPRLAERFTGETPEGALQLLEGDPAFAAVHALFRRYLEEFGVRSVEEMKLESFPIRDTPAFCIAMLQNYLRTASVPAPGEQEARERAIRTAAEERLREELRGKRSFLVVPRGVIFGWVLNKARNAIRNRENQRFARSEAYDLVRRMARAIGRNWQEREIIGEREDIFYLELGEIWAFIGGTSTCTDLKGLIALRRREFEEYRTRTPDDHIETRGEVYADNRFTTTAAAAPGDGILRGTGCCRGIVEGEVRVVLKPDSSLRLDGQIMVARQTDPGWIVLFPSIGGLIVEKGSMLSHSAIVAREMGIPAVVGVRGAATLLHDGDRVRLNGADGTVTVLEKA